MTSSRPNNSPTTSVLDSPFSYLLCELTVDGRTAADCALCRDVIQSACRVCLGNIGAGLASLNVVKQCSASVFIISVASSHLSEVWAAMTIASSFEKRGTSKLLLFMNF
jgi:RNase P/RNase MRP subunit POP5